MAREAKLSKVYKWALVIDEQELRRLVDECQRSVDDEPNTKPDTAKLALEVQFTDGLSFTTETLDDVAAEENPRARSISGLKIRASSSSVEILCNLASDPKDRSSSLSVRGSDRQWVYVTFSRVEDRLRRMKQWHAPGRTMIVPLVFGTMLIYASMLFLAGTRYPGLLEKATEDGKSRVTTLGGVALLSTLPMVLVVIIVVAILFPDPVFRIGDGAARHDRIKSIRSKLGWMILAILATAVLTRIGSVLIGLW